MSLVAVYALYLRITITAQSHVLIISFVIVIHYLYEPNLCHVNEHVSSLFSLVLSVMDFDFPEEFARL